MPGLNSPYLMHSITFDVIILNVKQNFRGTIKYQDAILKEKKKKGNDTKREMKA